MCLGQGEGQGSGLKSEELLPAEAQVMRAYVDQPRCRAAILSQYLDQVAWYCEDVDKSCDRCLRQGLRRQELGAGVDETAAMSQMEDREDEEQGSGKDEEDGESSSEAEDLEAGAEMLRGHVRDEERGVQQYVRGLQALQGWCVICWLDREGGWKGPSQGAEAEPHSMDGCRNPQKYRFFDAKRTATTTGNQRFRGKGGRRQGWLMAYTACFQCGNPQNVCPQQGRG